MISDFDPQQVLSPSRSRAHIHGTNLWSRLLAASLVLAASVVGIGGLPASAVTGPTCADILSVWLPDESDIYQVATIDQVYCLGTDSQAASALLDSSFFQTADLVWSARLVDVDPDTSETQLATDWSIVGSSGAPFTGTYDGNGKSITGLTWNYPDSGSEIGVFGSTSAAEIKNLSLLDVNIAGFYNVGGLAGELTNGTLVTNVHVTGAVSSGQNSDRYVGDYVGGIAGRATGTRATPGSLGAPVVISNSSFDGTVSAYGVRIGGAVGYGANLDLRGVAVGKASATSITVSKGPLSSSANNPNTAGNHSFVGGIAGVLEDSTVDGSVFAGSVTGKNLIGGIVGKISSGYIKRTTASGTVRGRGMTGGIAGWADGTQISDVSSSATVAQPLNENDGAGSNANYVGGIAGLIDNGGSIKRAINTGSVTGYSYVGGISGVLALVWPAFDPLQYGGSNGTGTIDQTYSIGTINGTFSNKISGAIVSQTNYQTESATVSRSFALAESAPFTVDRGTSWNYGIYVNDQRIGFDEDRLLNTFKTASELKTLATYSTGFVATSYVDNAKSSVRKSSSTGWNVAGTDGRIFSIVDGWYLSIEGFGPYWGICANHNGGYPFLLALETVKPVGCDPTTQSIAPEAPFGLQLLDTYHNTASARISFIAGETYGQASIQGYEYKVGPTGAWKTLSKYNPDNVNEGWTVEGLLKGVTNNVFLRPVLSSGIAVASGPLSIAVEAGDPDAPSSLVATPGDGSLSLAFVAGVSNGPEITNYLYSLNDGENWMELDPPQSSSPITISGLTRATTYKVKLRAVNSRNTGGGIISSAVDVTMPDVPTAPTELVATPGDRRVSIAFTAGLDNGSAITGYEYSIDGGENWVAESPAVVASPLVIAGLTNGAEYSVQVRALNAIGNGAESGVVEFTPVAPAVPVTPAVPAPPAVPEPPAVPATPSVPSTTISPSIENPDNAIPAPVEQVVLDLPTASEPLIEDASLASGSPVVLEFGGFVPFEFVQLLVASTPRVIGSGYADSEGKIRLSGLLPGDLELGEHSLALFAPESGRGIRQEITVEVAYLPATGISTNTPMQPALFLLLVGLALLVVSRRRHAR